MINSNFSCGYYINREKMFKMLKYTHQINSNFDPCSYPGIQCEFYYNTLIKEQTGIQPSTMRNNKRTAKDAKNVENIVKVSFMIFRTGSVLIVGKCSEEILYENLYEKFGSRFIDYRKRYSDNIKRLDLDKKTKFTITSAPENQYKFF